MEIETIEITHPDKVIFPGKKITKGEVAAYYERIADRILPFLKDRPLTLHRFPGGIGKSGFYQKNASDYFPDFIKRVEVETEEGINTQMLCNNKKSLLYLVNQNTLVFHIWLSKKDKLRQPDKVVFDMDPPDDSFEKVRKAARLCRDYLEKKQKNPQLMTTGQSGFHVYYKIRRGKDFDQVKEEVRDMAEEMAESHPDLLTTNIRKDQREGKIFVDYLRNAYAQTAVCPFSLRPNQNAGIAAPISWKELNTIEAADSINYNSLFQE